MYQFRCDRRREPVSPRRRFPGLVTGNFNQFGVRGDRPDFKEVTQPFRTGPNADGCTITHVKLHVVPGQDFGATGRAYLCAVHDSNSCRPA